MIEDGFIKYLNPEDSSGRELSRLGMGVGLNVSQHANSVPKVVQWSA